MLKTIKSLKDRFIREENVKLSIYALILRFLGVVTLFSATLFLTNFFSLTIVGSYEFTRSLLLLLGSLVVFGTDQSIWFFSGQLKSKGRSGELYSVYKKMVGAIAGLWIVFFVVFLCIPKSWINAYFDDTSSYALVFKTFSVLFFYGLTLLNTEMLRALGHIYSSELYKGVFKFAPLLVGALLLYLFGWQSYVVDVYLGGFVLLALISTVVIYLKLETLRVKTTLQTKKIVKSSLPMAISSLGFFLLMSIDILFLKRFSTFSNIAYYAIAMKLILLISTILNTVNAVAAPKIAELYEERDWTSLKKLLRSSVRLIFVLSAPLVIILFLFAKTVLGFFGDGYVAGSSALYILLLGHFFSTVCGCVAVYMNMTGKQRLFRNILLITVALNIGLNWFLIPKYGINGAAVASSVSIIFWNLTCLIAVFKMDGLKLYLG